MIRSNHTYCSELCFFSIDIPFVSKKKEAEGNNDSSHGDSYWSKLISLSFGNARSQFQKKERKEQKKKKKKKRRTKNESLESLPGTKWIGGVRC